MSGKLAGSFAFSLLFTASAAAGVTVDEATARLMLIARGSEGYLPSARLEMGGFASATDRAKLVWKGGGKTLATATCKLDIDGDWASGACAYDGKPIKYTGPVTAELIHWNDKTEKDSVVRTFRTTIKKKGGNYQIAADDVLGGAWVVHAGDGEGSSGGYRRPNFYLWFTSTDYANNFTARCTAGGKQLEDIRVSDLGGNDQGDVELRDDATGKTHHWRKAKLKLDVIWGKREDLDASVKPGKDAMLVDNVGAWECKLRKGGKTVREWRFTVTPDGMIANDEMQSGKNAVPLADAKVSFIDNRLTKDSASLDARFDPTTYKKSLQYGLPWPEHPKVKTIHAALPAKFGPSL